MSHSTPSQDYTATIENERLMQVERLIEVGVALSAEKNTTKLLEKILLAAKQLTHADGGTIYSVTASNELRFETLFNDQLDLYMGGTSDKVIPFSPIPLIINGEENHHALVAFSANIDQVINIPDAYEPFDGFDMTAAREMDKRIGYRTKSVLTVPMKNHEGKLNGVLQLINAQQGDCVVEFTKDIEAIVIALTSQAAVALTNRQLIDDMEELFRSFTKLLAKSIDEKSPYTGGHCRRVPEVTMLLAEASNATTAGPLADFTLDEEDMYALNIAAWLHDCGKIATPEYVMDKATKLETIFDRIEFVKSKFEIIKRDIEIEFLQKQVDLLSSRHAQTLDMQALQDIKQGKLDILADDLEFIIKANVGGEFMTPDDQQRIVILAEQYQFDFNDERSPLLNEDEIYNLNIAKGTLNDEERAIINRHISITIDMLNALPFPSHLRKVPEYAGGHHEKMDGSGYPNGLTREQMSVPARMMAIADIFEALTATDRPYKPAKTLSECLRILGFMKLDQHIDADLFDVFVDNKLYLKFAESCLDESQIDEVDLNKIPGYILPENR